MNDVIVIGVGNEFRRDDGVGPYAIERLKDSWHAENIFLTVTGGAGLHLMELWKDFSLAIVIDAVYADTSPGTVYRLNPFCEKIPKELGSFSTHTLNIAQTIELSRVLQEAPAHLIIYGITGENFGEGRGLSGPVQRAAEETIKRIQEDIETFLQHQMPPRQVGVD